jgi:Tripartite tricarboxylate transporter TctB family
LEKPSARADLAGALVWIGVGAAIVYGSWTMDRLERYGAALYAAPGLVPGLLGLVLLVLGGVLAVRALRQGLQRSAVAQFDLGNTPLVLLLCFGYAAGLVGRVPFWLATFAFVTSFIVVFEYPSRRRMAMAPFYGAGTSLVVTYLFESVFLVRLP